jgi:hypothetical protein
MEPRTGTLREARGGALSENFTPGARKMKQMTNEAATAIAMERLVGTNSVRSSDTVEDILLLVFEQTQR